MMKEVSSRKVTLMGKPTRRGIYMYIIMLPLVLSYLNEHESGLYLKEVPTLRRL